MAMNREQKRMLQRQGQIDAEGNPTRPQRQATQPRPQARPQSERTGPAQYVREVRAELRKVAWPTREEVVKYSLIVFFTIVFLTLLIFGLDYVVAKGVLFLFDK
jgi:preprotein translocase subunit SecE